MNECIHMEEHKETNGKCFSYTPSRLKNVACLLEIESKIYNQGLQPSVHPLQ